MQIFATMYAIPCPRILKLPNTVKSIHNLNKYVNKLMISRP